MIEVEESNEWMVLYNAGAVLVFLGDPSWTYVRRRDGSIMYDQNDRGVVYSCGVDDDHSRGLVILSCPRITDLHVVYDLDGSVVSIWS